MSNSRSEANKEPNGETRVSLKVFTLVCPERYEEAMEGEGMGFHCGERFKLAKRHNLSARKSASNCLMK